MSSCIVYLDNYQGQFYPGNTIVGRVVCSFNSPKNIRAIKLKLRGKEHTEWTKTENYYDDQDKTSKTRTVHCSGDNKFLNIENTIVGAGDINPGRHEYEFSLNLPKTLPGTYHGKYGSIKFSVKAIVDRPYKVDYEDEKEFTVVAPVDFNEIKDKLQLDPVVYSDDKTLCCCCCASGPITMNVHLQKEAFIQGETARVKLEITNLSNESIERVDIKLGMTIQTKVTSPSSETKSDYELISAQSDTGVGAHGERTYDFELEIPRSTAIPNFSLCELFSKWCTLKVTGSLPGCHNDMDMSSEIILGHIPIGGYQEQYQHMGLQQTVNPMMPPVMNNQYPGGMPYPPTASPYPSSDPPPYPALFPNPAPPSGGFGFQVPPATNPPPAGFPPLPSGGFPSGSSPNPLPYPPGPNAPSYPPPPGPSAPVMDSAASAPPKSQLAEESSKVVNSNTPLIAPFSKDQDEWVDIP